MDILYFCFMIQSELFCSTWIYISDTDRTLSH